MSEEDQRPNPPVRVSRKVYDELRRLQREFYEEYRVKPSMNAVIERLLAGQPVKP